MWAWVLLLLLPFLDIASSTTAATTGGCAYDGPFVNKKGINVYRIDIELDLSLIQCLAACTANVDCNGVSYEVGDNFTICLVTAPPFCRTLLLIHYVHKNATLRAVSGRPVIDSINLLVMNCRSSISECIGVECGRGHVCWCVYVFLWQHTTERLRAEADSTCVFWRQQTQQRLRRPRQQDVSRFACAILKMLYFLCF
jgi:hypothetical protein